MRRSSHKRSTHLVASTHSARRGAPRNDVYNSGGRSVSRGSMSILNGDVCAEITEHSCMHRCTGGGNACYMLATLPSR